MKTVTDLELSDIFYHLIDLAELMQATDDILHEMDYVRQDGTRINELDRVASMHRIACRDVVRIREMASALDAPSDLGERRASSNLSEIADAYRAARKAYLDREKVDSEAAGSSPEWTAFENAEEAFIRFPCETIGDVRVKATLVLNDDNLDDTIRNCYRMEGDKQIWTLVPFLNSLKGLEP